VKLGPSFAQGLESVGECEKRWPIFPWKKSSFFLLIFSPYHEQAQQLPQAQGLLPKPPQPPRLQPHLLAASEPTALFGPGLHRGTSNQPFVRENPLRGFGHIQNATFCGP